MARLYALDTNVYVAALRAPQRLERLKRFLVRTGTRMRVSAIVAMEMRAGARTAAQERDVETLVRAYADRGRAIAPSFDACLEAGRVLAALAARQRVQLGRAGSLVNDVLLAVSCREAGAVLVTDDARDFTAIQRNLRGFRFVAPDEVM